jgi:hypothetical protein
LGDIIGLIATIVVAIWAPELLGEEFELTGSLGAVTAGVAGFVGGFVGGLVSTGSLSAALTAGLISGVTALAFYGAGVLSNDVGANWRVPTSVLAHAVLGCGSAALSGGNCGRGAFAAAVSDSAAQTGFIDPKATGVWGISKGAAESGLIGGIAAEIEGGKFTDGFSVSAAGYLFNEAAHSTHVMPHDPEDASQEDLNQAEQIEDALNTAPAGNDRGCAPSDGALRLGSQWHWWCKSFSGPRADRQRRE